MTRLGLAQLARGGPRAVFLVRQDAIPEEGQSHRTVTIVENLRPSTFRKKKWKQRCRTAEKFFGVPEQFFWSAKMRSWRRAGPTVPLRFLKICVQTLSGKKIENKGAGKWGGRPEKTSSGILATTKKLPRSFRKLPRIIIFHCCKLPQASAVDFCKISKCFRGASAGAAPAGNSLPRPIKFNEM